MKYQVIEKESYATDWAIVRYGNMSMTRFDSEGEALDAACKYITDRNCDNPLAADEKLKNAECFMIDVNGCYLGVLDGNDWYLKYPKDGPRDKDGNPKYLKGDVVKDKTWFELEGKTEVSVRPIRGT